MYSDSLNILQIKKRLEKIEKDGKILFLTVLTSLLVNVSLITHVVMLVKKH
jgi:hypothetical protein